MKKIINAFLISQKEGDQMSKRCRHISVRLNPDDPKHVHIIDVLDDLNLDVHKSKNRFLVNALLVKLIPEGTSKQLTIDETQAEIIKGLGFGETLIMLILASLLAVVIIACGFLLIYSVYFRFLRLLIIVPIGSIAFSTMGGNRMVAHTTVSFWKYFIGATFEAVTMALAIVVCNAFINSGLPQFTSEYADWTKTLIYLCEMTFAIAMTVGSVKGAQNLTSRLLGL